MKLHEHCSSINSGLPKYSGFRSHCFSFLDRKSVAYSSEKEHLSKDQITKAMQPINNAIKALNILLPFISIIHNARICGWFGTQRKTSPTTCRLLRFDACNIVYTLKNNGRFISKLEFDLRTTRNNLTSAM